MISFVVRFDIFNYLISVIAKGKDKLTLRSFMTMRTITSLTKEEKYIKLK